MILKRVIIHKYKSFLTEQSFKVEPGITRIVGKNESGKTALLEAIAKTNYFEKSEHFKFVVEMDYPRIQSEKLPEGQPKETQAVTCEYEITNETMDKIIADIGKDVLENRNISLTHYYDNTEEIYDCDTDFKKFKLHIIKKHKISNMTEEIRNASSFEDLIELVASDISLKDLHNELGRIKKAADKFPNKLDNILDKYVYYTHVQPNLPKFWYFDDYYSIPCRIDINNFANGNPNKSLTEDEYNITKALFELIELNISDIQNEQNYEMFKSKLESKSNDITDIISKYWTTNEKLEIRFDVEHNPNGPRYFNIRVFNPKHRLTLPLKNRSRGFIWFFSFIVWFSKIQGSKNTKYILLLDEPGLSLHATAQKDLLKYIDEKLKPKYQVLYTTHSPFMIDTLYLNEVRTVYDNQKHNKGSIVSEATIEKDSETLFPLQAALGYTIAQNLYISKKNLLVEGISDLVYLNHFSAILKNNHCTGLSEDITIVPVGGADKIATFISLMRGNNLDSVCLLDKFADQSAKARLDNLIAQKIIQKNKVLFYNDILGNSFVDIEDLFEKNEYLSLFNKTFSMEINIKNIDNSKPIMKQLKHVNNDEDFDHYQPANYMMRNIANLEFSNATQERFENLFTAINKLFL